MHGLLKTDSYLLLRRSLRSREEYSAEEERESDDDEEEEMDEDVDEVRLRLRSGVEVDAA